MIEQTDVNRTIANKNGTRSLPGKNGHQTDSIYFKVKVPEHIVNRDGRIVPFDLQRIEEAMR